VAVGKLLPLIAWRAARTAMGLLVFAAIVADFHFSSASMTRLAPTNAAYEALRGKTMSAIGIPFMAEADHYMNATYQYFALTHDVRMANGHSSLYPPEWDVFYEEVHDLNSGMAIRDTLRSLERRGIGFIIAHATPYAPNVTGAAVQALDRNPALQRIAADEGIVAYKIVDSNLAPKDYSGVRELAGWYRREVYPGQRPFRWMAGTTALLRVKGDPPDSDEDVSFEYKCPFGRLEVRGEGIVSKDMPSDRPEWRRVVLDVPNDSRASTVSVVAAAPYTVAGDSRVFGCMVGDFDVHASLE
jgi:hypothetical protein